MAYRARRSRPIDVCVPDSVVHYRYGSFGATTIQRPTGEIAFAVRSPSGVLEPDVRGSEYRPPPWAVDPFVIAGVALEMPTRPAIVGDRFLVIDELYRSARGHIYLGVDLDLPQTCVLKSAEAGALMAPGGRDARDQLRHEAAILDRLGPDPRFPMPLALVEHGNELYLVMSDLKASTLESYVRARTAKGCTLDQTQVVAWGRELATMLSAIHAAGLVYRDLKSTNILVTTERPIAHRRFRARVREWATRVQLPAAARGGICHPARSLASLPTLPTTSMVWAPSWPSW